MKYACLSQALLQFLSVPMGRGGECRDGPEDLPEGMAPLDAVDANVWFIHGAAYDLTQDGWIEKHPGGRYILDITRGTDCTGQPPSPAPPLPTGHPASGAPPCLAVTQHTAQPPPCRV